MAAYHLRQHLAIYSVLTWFLLSILLNVGMVLATTSSKKQFAGGQSQRVYQVRGAMCANRQTQADPSCISTVVHRTVNCFSNAVPEANLPGLKRQAKPGVS